MKNGVKIFGICILFLYFLSGCAGADKEASKDQRFRCAKCAGYFDSPQGAAFFDWMQGPDATRK